MTTDQIIRLNMHLTVRNCVVQNEAVAKGIPRFMDNYQILQNTTDEIQQISEMQALDQSGIASNKNKLKKSLIAMTAKNSRKVAALGKFNNDDILLKEVTFARSELERMKEVNLIKSAQTVYNKAEENIESLAEHGITPETQKLFIDTITSLNRALKTPRSSIAERKKSTERLIVLFQTADKALEMMDYAVGIVRDEQVDFASVYDTSRKLVDTNTGIISLKARATELASGAPIKGVKFTFTPESVTMSINGKLVKKTARKGSFQIRNMPAGTYTVLVQKAGYKEKQVSISISDSERSDLNVSLEK